MIKIATSIARKSKIAAENEKNSNPNSSNVYANLLDISEPKKAKALIGYLPEMRPLYKEFTVNEYLTIAARFHKVPSSKIKKALEEAKEKCGLSHIGKRVIEN